MSLGCQLGPTFAEFHMCNLENKVFGENQNLLPSMYARYVDDVFMVVQNWEQVETIKSNFEEHSELKFTHEHEKAKSLFFMDTVVTRLQTDFHTAIYTKNTITCNYTSYKIACPERYKVAVIKTLLHQSYHVLSDWTIFDLEIKIIEQLLTNNIFPMKLTSNTIAKFINEKFEPSVRDNKREEIKVFFRVRWLLTTIWMKIYSRKIPASTSLQLQGKIKLVSTYINALGS